MSRYAKKPCKGESPDKTPYTIYYPHDILPDQQFSLKWPQNYIQLVSIDPARKNYALRIERRYMNGLIIPLVFDKVEIEEIVEMGGVTMNKTYKNLTSFLEKYENFYNGCHMIIIERQMVENYQATRIAQHTMSYFDFKLKNNESSFTLSCNSPTFSHLIKIPYPLLERDFQ